MVAEAQAAARLLLSSWTSASPTLARWRRGSPRCARPRGCRPRSRLSSPWPRAPTATCGRWSGSSSSSACGSARCASTTPRRGAVLGLQGRDRLPVRRVEVAVPGEAARAGMGARLDAALCDSRPRPVAGAGELRLLLPGPGAVGCPRPELTKLRLLARAADGISVGGRPGQARPRRAGVEPAARGGHDAVRLPRGVRPGLVRRAGGVPRGAELSQVHGLAGPELEPREAAPAARRAGRAALEQRGRARRRGRQGGAAVRLRPRALPRAVAAPGHPRRPRPPARSSRRRCRCCCACRSDRRDRGGDGGVPADEGRLRLSALGHKVQDEGRVGTATLTRAFRRPRRRRSPAR